MARSNWGRAATTAAAAGGVDDSKGSIIGGGECCGDEDDVLVMTTPKGDSLLPLESAEEIALPRPPADSPKHAAQMRPVAIQRGNETDRSQ